MRPLPSLLLLGLVVLACLFQARPARGQSGIELEDVRAAVRFGEQVTFSATVRTPVPIQEASIVILDETQGITLTESLSLPPDGRTEFRLDLRRQALRPFTLLRWSYIFRLPDGSSRQSEVFSILYEDNRFAWQTLESGALRVHWYDGGAGFGQAALEAVRSGLESVGRLIPVDLDEPVEFYIYASLQDLRGTLVPGSQEWVAGHADPGLGVVMVAVEPGPGRDVILQQRIPHELMHVMLYRAVGEGYGNVPSWLREGTAALAEVVPNLDHERLLEAAVARQDWIPILHLCGAFPSEAGRALLAYAESRSFTGYLYETYGPSGLLQLARAYAGGADCEQGLEQALGVPLSRLESDWHAAVVGRPALLPALQNMAPYLVLLCLILLVPLAGIVGTIRRKRSRHGPETYVRK